MQVDLQRVNLSRLTSIAGIIALLLLIDLILRVVVNYQQFKQLKYANKNNHELEKQKKNNIL